MLECCVLQAFRAPALLLSQGRAGGFHRAAPTEIEKWAHLLGRPRGRTGPASENQLSQPASLQCPSPVPLTSVG